MGEVPVKVTDACTGCGVCVDVCPFGAVDMVNGKAVINEACRACGQCVDACPVGAIVMSEAEAVDLSDYRGVMVYAEQRGGRVHPVSYELLGKAQELAAALSEPVYAVIVGSGVGAGAEELVNRGADKVFLYDDPALAEFRDDPYTDLLAQCCRDEKPSIFLIGATSLGRSLGPRVAAKLHTGLTADCTYLDIDPETGLLRQTRPAYGGNIMATIVTPNSRPQMATVRYKMFTEAAKVDNPKGSVVEKAVDMSKVKDRVKVLGFEEAKEQVSISEADLIVSGGLGLGDPEGFELIRELAETLGAAVGASRPTVDEGWIDYRHQVGLSGRTVRPQVYMACGISGAVQHQAGMKTSDVIIAVNKDPEAPIFKISSLGVVGDLYEVIPRLIEKIKEHEGHA
ncbi:MAG TPA: electron transfer flavoprotein subunit alpha [Candidatus Krumholzibacteriaceae bacterium]|nr:electron transfer flavoprotein subunit alpha [Candidatus Krumholzibacteriaceae bacterium]